MKLSDFGIARCSAAGGSTGRAACWARRSSWPLSRPTAARSIPVAISTVWAACCTCSWPAIPCITPDRLPRCSINSGSRSRRRCGSLRPDIPVELEQIIHRLLEKDPDLRFATATVLGRAPGDDVGVIQRLAACRRDADRAGTGPRRFPGGRRSAADRPAGADHCFYAGCEPSCRPGAPCTRGSRGRRQHAGRGPAADPQAGARFHRGRRPGPRPVSFRFGPESSMPRRRSDLRQRGFLRKLGPS